MIKTENEVVKRVRDALKTAGQPHLVRTIAASAGATQDAAQELGVERGQVVKARVYAIGSRYVMAVVAGDRKVREDQLPRIFNMGGAVLRPGPDLISAVTGFPKGGLSPAGMVANLPICLDASLKRFDKLFAVAGDRHVVFETSVAGLKALTGGLTSYALAEPLDDEKSS
ncbi:MAG: YbaK/EbsC family protein [Alphaproteobacteria bacterium]|nr:YbaK/EbsC family protein [Alphaproteobacteria bacterium]MBF0250264.1 YbaK/EbsC family protein [Alphaproteobacteria bacterium]